MIDDFDCIEMKTIESQKANTYEWTQGKDLELGERAPEINQAVINLIGSSHCTFFVLSKTLTLKFYAVRSEQQQRDPATKIVLTREESRNKPQKNIDHILAETNRMIINNILFNKISQQMKRQPSANVSRNESSEDIVTKSHVISGDTMSNFRSLQGHLAMPPSMVIDYQALWKRLNFNATGSKKMFDYSEYQKKAEEERYKFETQEKDLLKKFQDIVLEIQEKKALQSEIRYVNHDRITKIKLFQDEVAFTDD